MTNSRNKMGSGATAALVDEKNARVSCSVFTDPDIHANEIERIFNRSWLFLGHESELPRSGDYVTRPMGNDQVIVVRGDDGRIRGFLNSCRHRGVQLCRADTGRIRRFVCPYHGWTYDTKGSLVTTSYDQHYDPGDLVNSDLIPIAKLEMYRGLIFGNWDPHAASLDAHLHDIKWYLDLLFGRTPGGVKVIAPPQRWIIETNWKIPALNFIDSQHAIRTHAGALSVTMGQIPGAPPLPELQKITAKTPTVGFPQGHGIVLGSLMTSMPEFFGHYPGLVPLYKQTLNPEQLRQLVQAPPTVGTIFPNTSWVEPLLRVATDTSPIVYLGWRNWQPRGVNKVEVWSWYFAAAETPADWCAEMHKVALQTFGMGGIYEEDDAEVWATMSSAIQGPIASRQLMNFSAGRSSPALKNSHSPGTVYPSQFAENVQLAFMNRWKQIMEPAAPYTEEYAHGRE